MEAEEKRARSAASLMAWLSKMKARGQYYSKSWPSGEGALQSFGVNAWQEGKTSFVSLAAAVTFATDMVFQGVQQLIEVADASTWKVSSPHLPVASVGPVISGLVVHLQCRIHLDGS